MASELHLNDDELINLIDDMAAADNGEMELSVIGSTGRPVIIKIKVIELRIP